MTTFAGLGFSVLGILLLALLALILSSYIKIVTVLSIVRTGLGMHGLPEVFVTSGLALVLSFFVMYPTIEKSLNQMDEVYRQSGGAASDMVRARALEVGLQSWLEFLEQHAGKAETDRFVEVARQIDAGQTDGSDNVGGELVTAKSWRILGPAFLVSELKEAFATGLSLFLPFLIIDLCVASALVAVGMNQLSPSVVAFPFKLMLFVLIDGWALITTNLVATYG